MIQVRAELRKIATVSVILFLVVFCIILFYEETNFNSIGKACAQTSSILFLIALFWAFYNKWGWKWRICRLGGWLSTIPDLNGRWEGTICRNKNDSPHKFVLEISQTFTTLTFKTFTQHSRGESICAVIFTNETNELYTVISIWRTWSKQLTDYNAEDSFEGTSYWHIGIDNNKKTIEIDYYTRREPQTKGSGNLEWKSSKLLNRFSE